MATPLVVGAAAAGAKVGLPTTARGFMVDYWTGMLALVGLVLLAYFTNPNPASFRTHLTSQSFHTHLRRLSSSPSQGSIGSAPLSGTSAATSNARDPPIPSQPPPSKRKESGTNPADRNASKQASPFPSNRHILSFSNRISLSIKTPSYKFTSFYLFSTVYVPPSRPPTASVANKRQQQQLKKHPELGALLGLGGELWFGVFRNWYALKLWENEEQDEEERRGRVERGVKEMRVEDENKALDQPSSSTAPSASASLSGSSTPAHPLATSSLDRSPSICSQPAEPVPPASSISKQGPAAARLAKRVFRAGQRRSSPTSLTRLKSKAEHAAREAAEAEKPNDHEGVSALPSSSSKDGGANAASVGGAGGRTTFTDPVLVELQAQLDELRATTADSEKRLQDELEVLRGKKRDEDAFRAELKAKTKTLEEAKRIAEASRVEAEKDLNERKGAVKEVQARVDKLREEIRALERKGKEAVERKEKKKRDRREREKKLREDVLKKRDELKEKEEGLAEVLQKVGEMERKLEVRRALLAARRTELAQLAARGQPANSHSAMYSIPSHHSNLPPTATLGGVGAVANAFAAPFGQGAYGRRNYPYVHPLSANNSRPGSIRSGHFDPLTGTFRSAPSSPTFSHPVSPHDDALASYNADAASGWPSSFASGPVGGGGNASALTQPGFLEHRIHHRTANALPSTDDLPSHFHPFDFDSLHSANDASPPLRSARADSLDDNSLIGNKPRPPLALPLQYLDSGLLATSTPSGMGFESPSQDTGPLSPMTPHQTSLIPSQLFHMLDEDDDDDGLFAMPDSPTMRGAQGLGVDWKGLGLEVDDRGGSRRNSPTMEEGTQDGEHDGNNEVEATSPAVNSPQAQSSSLAPGGDTTASATTSPLGPPPTSPFSPWDASAGPVGADLSSAAASAFLHRASPSHDFADDLPRAGLSLNPDAKAFAFPFAPAVGSHTHARTSSVPSPPINGALDAIARPSRSGTSSSLSGSSLPSPNAIVPPSSSVFNLDAAPAKSRMDFATSSSSSGPVGPLSARLSPGCDWPKSTHSPRSAAPTVAPIGTGAGGNGAGPGSGKTTPVLASTAAAATSTSSFNPFNPFDEEDELLGPLKR
ncbi:hypothetical protein JCM11641_007229 [Rhodosporidiobolus odoratus]